MLTASDKKVLAAIAGACAGTLAAICIVAAIGFAQHSDERDERAAQQAQESRYAQLDGAECRTGCGQVGK